MTNSEPKLSSGVDLGSIVVASYYGIKRYGLSSAIAPLLRKQITKQNYAQQS